MIERPKLLRSWMFVPGDRQRMIGKALSLPVDAIMMDIEDGVAPTAKENARVQIGAALDDQELLRSLKPYFVGAAFELHEDIVSIDEWNLVVDQQVAGRGSLVGNKWIVNEIGQNAIQVLPGIGNATGVCGVLPPLGPG